jgi:hypothetical protein
MARYGSLREHDDEKPKTARGGLRSHYGIKGQERLSGEVYIIYLIRHRAYVSFSGRLSSDLRFQRADLKPNIAC